MIIVLELNRRVANETRKKTLILMKRHLKVKRSSVCHPRPNYLSIRKSLLLNITSTTKNYSLRPNQMDQMEMRIIIRIKVLKFQKSSLGSVFLPNRHLMIKINMSQKKRVKLYKSNSKSHQSTDPNPFSKNQPIV